MFSILGLSQNWTSLIVLLALIAIIYIFDRKNFKRDGVVFMRRTKRGLAFIDSFAQKHEKFFLKFGSFGILLSFGATGAAYILAQQKKKFGAKTWIVIAVVLAALLSVLPPAAAIVTTAFGASGLIVSELVLGAVKIFSAGPAAAPVVQPVLPVQATGVFFVPIEFWLISIFVIMVVHEFAHAFVARAEKIRVKSIGYGFAAILPLGFAEPDEAQLKKADSLKKSRVFAAGSLSNFITGIIALVLFIAAAFAASAIFVSAGVAYSGTADGSPAHGVLPESGVITEVQGSRITTVSDISQAMQNVSVGSRISITVDGKEYGIVTAARAENASQPFIGILNLQDKVQVKERFASIVGPSFASIFIYLIMLFNWLFMLNVGVGLANLLPIKPLDGGLIFEEVAKTLWPKSWKHIYRAVAFTALGLLLLSLGWGLFGKAISSLL